MTEKTHKVEFASPQWLDIAREYLTEQVAHRATSLDGVRFAICESVTDAPSHLTGATTITWHMVFDGPTFRVGFGAIADADIESQSRYEEVLSAARTVYAEHPELLEASRAQRRDDDVPGLPPPLGEMLLGLHDHLARHTA